MPTIVNHKFKWFKIKVPISNDIFRYTTIKITVCIMNKVKNGNNERQLNEILLSSKANDNESAGPDVQQTAAEREECSTHYETRAQRETPSPSDVLIDSSHQTLEHPNTFRHRAIIDNKIKLKDDYPSYQAHPYRLKVWR